MVIPWALAAVSLLALPCRAGAVAPDDEQVLVQRATLLQQLAPASLEGRNPGPRSLDLAEAVAGLAREGRRLQGRLGRDPIGKNGEVCTEQEMAHYLEKQKAFAEKQRKSAEKLNNELFNKTQQVWAKHLKPFTQAFTRIAKMTDPILRPIIRDMVMYILMNIAKYPHPYEVKNISQSFISLRNAMKNQTEPIKSILAEGFRDYDVLLEQAVDDLPMSTKLRKIVFTSPPGIARPEDAPKYFLRKVLPIIGLEIYPKFARVLTTFSSIPLDDIISWIWNEVWPLATESFSDAWMKEYQTSMEEIPTRYCVTCQERYESSLANLDDGCFLPCVRLAVACVSAIDSKCFVAGSDCIQCQTQYLASFDACNGTNAHAPFIEQWNAVASTLNKASTQQGFNRLLEETSRKIMES